jgi:hypothetical protein
MAFCSTCWSRGTTHLQQVEQKSSRTAEESRNFYCWLLWRWFFNVPPLKCMQNFGPQGSSSIDFWTFFLQIWIDYISVITMLLLQFFRKCGADLTLFFNGDEMSWCRTVLFPLGSHCLNAFSYFNLLLQSCSTKLNQT